MPAIAVIQVRSEIINSILSVKASKKNFALSNDIQICFTYENACSVQSEDSGDEFDVAAIETVDTAAPVTVAKRLSSLLVLAHSHSVLYGTINI